MIRDIIHYIKYRDVINQERVEEDKQYNDLLIEIRQLKKELELIEISRNRYLENCKKKTSEIRILKKENKQLKEKLKEVL